MIQVSNLSKAYGTQIIFDDVGFMVNAGERIGLTGRNGSGKTTLLRMITGEAKPDPGVLGIPNNYKIGYLSQHLQFSQDSVLKEACLGLKPSEDGRDESYKAEKILMGSDYPYGWVGDLSRCTDSILALGLDDGDTKKILHKNAERILRLDAGA